MHEYTRANVRVANAPSAIRLPFSCPKKYVVVIPAAGIDSVMHVLVMKKGSLFGAEASSTDALSLIHI